MPINIKDMKGTDYIKTFFKDWWMVFANELKMIFSDKGVITIFFVATLLYPLLYNTLYHGGTVDDMPIAVVDLADSYSSRSLVRSLDATRELKVQVKCASMAEAEELMASRKVHGIVLVPKEYDELRTRGESAHISTYADMSAMLYYKTLTMGVNHVTLDIINSGSLEPLRYTENIPYDRNMTYTLFFIPAVLMVVIQQALFYGSSMLIGTQRENNRSFSSLPSHLSGRGMNRVLLGRGAAYYLIFAITSMYVAFLVPAMFSLPQRGSFWQILLLLFFYLNACIAFTFTWSNLIWKRETVFLLLLFFSPICLFLTGFSWPVSQAPVFWQWFSYLFPSTFGARAFINMNAAGADISMVSEEIGILTIQTMGYYFTAAIFMGIENKVLKHKGTEVSIPGPVELK